MDTVESIGSNEWIQWNPLDPMNGYSGIHWIQWMDTVNPLESMKWYVTEIKLLVLVPNMSLTSFQINDIKSVAQNISL